MADALAARIRQAREEAGLSRELVAGQIGVSLATLIRYETDDRNRITLDKLQRIAEVTGKPLVWFINDVAA